MSNRVSIKADERTRARLRTLKRKGETWDGVLIRAADALESDDQANDGWPAPGVCAECGGVLATWTLVDGSTLCLDCAGIDEDAALPE